jgi:hypothetical protein
MPTKKLKKTSKKISIQKKTSKKTNQKTNKKSNQYKTSKQNNKSNKQNNITKQNNKSNKRNKQKGSSILNTMGSSMFTISKKKNFSSPFQKFTKNPLDRFSGNQKKKELLTINYNYKTPSQFIINDNNFYLSSKILIAPHVQLTNFVDQFLLVMILSGIKPKLLWACNFKFGSKNGSVIGYLVPQQPIGSVSTVIFKLYKYPPNTVDIFKIKNSMVVKRRKAFRKLKKYLRHHNMENSVVVTKQISVRQDKGTDITRLFTQITH